MNFDLDFTDDSWTEDEFKFRRNDRALRNRQYSDAYGDYRGGYGPGPFRAGPDGPPGPLMGPPPGPMMGPPMIGPPGRPMPQRMFPRGPMGPPPVILGRGFGPNGPPMGNKLRGDPPAIKYLMRCGVPKSTLKGLPKKIFDLIEPENCGLCGRSFESFLLSRVHYVSKAHQKSVKKWLTQNGSVGRQNHIQQGSNPLRARELYCEICDVQITSKIHGESHYDGKSHKAIVEGRKQPKNPMLLQRGMERRLQQLIRREKKFLKKDTESKEDEEVTEVKDVKPVQPDLYCDICKTSVTCSEQMTAHLNGKRHLAKEKNYILRSMRGEIQPSGEGNGEAEVAIKQEVQEMVDGAEEGAEEGAEDAAAEEGTAEEGAAEEEWNENWEN